MYMNRLNGQWDCKVCGEKGNLITLGQRFRRNGQVASVGNVAGRVKYVTPKFDVTEAQKRLASSRRGMDYLHSRGLNDETISYFALGLEVDVKGDEWIAIPHFEDEKLVNVKYRRIIATDAEARFRRITGCKSILFHADVALKEDCESVVIAEGEFCAMSWWQNGVKSVVSSTTGCEGFAAEWLDQLKDMKKIYLAYDNDAPGRKAVGKLADRLDISRCFIVNFPDGINDANEALQKGIKLSDLLDSAKQPEVQNIVSHTQAMEQVLENTIVGDGIGLETPWENVNRIMGKMKAGDVIMVSAKPKVGKTTMTINIAWNLVRRDPPVPVLVYCLEMPPVALVKRTLQMEYGITESEIDHRRASQCLAELVDVPLYFGFNTLGVTREGVMNTIRAAVKRYGIEFVVFDNLQFLVRDPRYVTQETGAVSKDFKLLAMELGIPIMVIVQTRKTDADKIIEAEDMRDSSSLATDCDTAVILHRRITVNDDQNEYQDTQEILSPVTLVRVVLSRNNPGGQTKLYFEGDKAKFRELTDDEKDALRNAQTNKRRW
ncbi:MAG: hypothetical protein A3I06_13970 [Candidatus Lindowbacteria bacterium RIFCSPLOWO2_02_FULL_62_12]|nr:MAG: hypothetical protein A3I06_13970 [Candidatus Lindowbacteria bacterium RIFCSPLOWO2_02_FULL_62_12]